MPFITKVLERELVLFDRQIYDGTGTDNTALGVLEKIAEAFASLKGEARKKYNVIVPNDEIYVYQNNKSIFIKCVFEIVNYNYESEMFEYNMHVSLRNKIVAEKYSKTLNEIKQIIQTRDCAEAKVLNICRLSQALLKG